MQFVFPTKLLCSKAKLKTELNEEEPIQKFIRNKQTNNQTKYDMNNVDDNKIKMSMRQKKKKNALLTITTNVCINTRSLTVYGKKYKGRYLIKVSECLEKDVMNTLMDNVRFGQKAASTVFRNLISALLEVHNDNLIHRDLKPENFMFVNNNMDRTTDLTQMGMQELSIKLIDFGSAAQLPVDELELPCPVLL